jgi:hypothetical protein
VGLRAGVGGGQGEEGGVGAGIVRGEGGGGARVHNTEATKMFTKRWQGQKLNNATHWLFT